MLQEGKVALHSGEEDCQCDDDFTLQKAFRPAWGANFPLAS